MLVCVIPAHWWLSIRGGQAVRLDFNRPETFGSALRGANAVFLLTPRHERMPAWVASLVAVAKAVGVDRIVRLSAMGANWQSAITLGRGHRAAEKAIEQSGLEYTILRPQAGSVVVCNSSDAELLNSCGYS